MRPLRENRFTLKGDARSADPLHDPLPTTPEGRPISPTLTNLVLLAGLVAIAVLIRLAVLTGRTDDAANDARWAELNDLPVTAERARPGALTGLLVGLVSAAGRMTAFASAGIVAQRLPRRPVASQPPARPAREG